MKIIEILIPLLLREDSDMLDISILSADKLVLDKKTKSVDPNKAQAFLNQNFTVEEKADGTKLSLWRNEQPFDPNDYTKNWVVAYKNHIIWPEEFGDLDRGEIKKSSIGYSQYALVHDHLQSVQGQLGQIPNKTEFFIEFIQNKPTTTRDYEKYHELWLIAYAPAEGSVSGGTLKTKPSGFFQDKNNEYAKILGLKLPPVVFQGNPSTAASFQQGIKSEQLQHSFEQHVSEFETDPYTAVKNTFLGMSSVLGGKPEGVVLKTEGGEYYKFLQSDQHDPGVRAEKKLRYKGSMEEENVYWAKVSETAKNLIAQLKSTDLRAKLQEISQLVYKFPEGTIQHSKKDIYKIRDDLMLTTRNILLSELPENQNAIFIGRFQPLTLAHANIIRDGLKKYSKVYIVLVKGEQSDKIKNPFSLELQQQMINALGFGDRTPIIINDSGKLIGADGIISKIKDGVSAVICGQDRQASYSQQLAKSRIKLDVIPRTAEDISATKVRDALKTGNQQLFNSLTDPAIHSFYNALKQVIDRQNSQ